MQLGADGVFVGSGIFKSGRDKHNDFDGSAEDVSRRAKAIVEATTAVTEDPRRYSADWGTHGGHLVRVARRERTARSSRLVGPDRSGPVDPAPRRKRGTSRPYNLGMNGSPPRIGVLALQGAFRGA